MMEVVACQSAYQEIRDKVAPKDELIAGKDLLAVKLTSAGVLICSPD